MNSFRFDRSVFAAAVVVFLVTSSSGLYAADLPPGLTRLLKFNEETSSVRAIATFDSVPGSTQVAALQSLGLTVQPMQTVPLALLAGPVSAMESAVAAGLAADVYPDEPIELLDTASSDAMGAAIPRQAGLTGKGVTVAVVDSGCDATRDDLKKRVVRNVKLYSGEYANLRTYPQNGIIVAVEVGPGQNTDVGSGHGTHVAGIIAADGTTGANHFGVAPEADLVCYSIGEVVFTTAVVTAYDHMLRQPDMWSIDVANNSWGNSFRQFDPNDPVAVVTKAVADRGVSVIFAAGNSGRTNAEMSLNPFSEAPWVTSVAASTLAHKRASFSSNGLQFDNSEPNRIPADGHSVYIGDRVGLYHPDVTAPGLNISSTCTPTGPTVPCLGVNATASGTSMASPHVAGAAAVLLQANPNLTVDELRMALQGTATPVLTDDGTGPLAFWQVGYGHVDLSAAVNLVRSKNWSNDIRVAQLHANNRVRVVDGYKVRRSDFWTWDAPPVAVEGVTDHRTKSTAVSSSVTHLKVTLSHPSDAVLGRNDVMTYTVTVRDASGRIIGVTKESPSGAGTSSVLIDLTAIADPAVAYGTFTFEVVGKLALSDPDTIDSESLLGRLVALQVAQMVKQDVQ